MSWLDLPRTPEAEVMDDADEVEAYASAAAQKHLDAVDDTLVEQALKLGPGGRLLDLGCGPGRIALKIAARAERLRAVGVDRSPRMVAAARRAAAEQGLADRVGFFIADGNHLSLPDASFDFILSNSVLHHLENPIAVIKEMARVSKPGAVILVRDLRRPSRLVFPLHIRWHGRYYFGLMKQLFIASVRAAYTPEEMAGLLARAGLGEAEIFLHRRTHLGFICKADGAAPANVSPA